MSHSNENKSGTSRREFMQRTGAISGLALTGMLGSCQTEKRTDNVSTGESVGIVLPEGDAVAGSPPGRFAVEELRGALTASGVGSEVYGSMDVAAGSKLCILAAGAKSQAADDILRGQKLFVTEASEAMGIAHSQINGRHVVLAAGHDPRGLTYAVLELADVVRYSDDPVAALRSAPAIAEKPANRIRSVLRAFVSDAEDKAWYNDKEFWQRYLTMLATQRFNRFNLALGIGYDFARGLLDTYFYFAYPFLVSVPGYDVRARGLSDAERDQNLAMLKYISDETVKRGMDFQLGIWTHAYQWEQSPNANYVIEGLTPDKQATYSRDALQKVLEVCPSITGITLRTHGESGVNEGSFDVWRTIMDGAVRASKDGRKIEIDLHAKGLDEQMINTALSTGLPVTLSPKFWAEHEGLPYHQSSIRGLELPRERNSTGLMALSNGTRSFLRYGYGDLLKEDRKYKVIHRIWPGTQRLLLWGDPLYAAEYGRAFSFCSTDGFEMFDPLGFKGRKGSGIFGSKAGRSAYADLTLVPPAGDWEKYLYTYRLMGRLSYNPDCSPEVWRRELRNEYGGAAESVEGALGNSSRILPLFTTAHDPSGANNNYWPEMYLNMSIVDPSKPGPYTDTPTPRVFGNVSSLDPQLFASVNEYVTSLREQKVLGKITPLEVAWQLDAWANAAMYWVARAKDQAGGQTPSPAMRRMQTDVTIASGLGWFFAAKFRAAVAFAIYDQTAYEAARTSAVFAYRQAREHWVKLAQAATGVYATDVTFGFDVQLRGHWQDRLAAIDQDIAAVGNHEARADRKDVSAAQLEHLATTVMTLVTRWKPSVTHTPPTPFRKGEALSIQLMDSAASVAAARLYYRHVNQGELHRSADMEREGNRFAVAIEGAYTNSDYPLEYYFELRDKQAQVGLVPGFAGDFLGQPYYVVRQS